MLILRYEFSRHMGLHEVNVAIRHGCMNDFDFATFLFRDVYQPGNLVLRLVIWTAKLWCCEVQYKPQYLNLQLLSPLFELATCFKGKETNKKEIIIFARKIQILLSSLFIKKGGG